MFLRREGITPEPASPPPSVVRHSGHIPSLTKDNASYGRKPFPLKKGAPGLATPCYAESPFFIERELSTVDDWNLSE